MITIINYGLGNLGSIKNMFRKLNIESEITSDLETIKNASKLVLPGVGAFDKGMENLREMGLIEILNKKVLEEKTPILGICLGMQLFTKSSEEGQLPGLAYVDAKTIRFDASQMAKRFPIPHMGWEYTHPLSNSKIMDGMHEDPKFYFVHSYFVQCENEKDAVLEANYMHPFHAAFEKDNIVGVQFHPEKSHKYGMKLLENFAKNY